jgi:integrase
LFWNDNTPITLATSFLVLDQASCLAHTSLWARANALKYFFSYLEDNRIDFDLLRFHSLEAYRNYLLSGDKPVSIQTAKTYITHLTEFLKWCKDKGELRIFEFPNQTSRLWRGRLVGRSEVKMPRPERKDVKTVVFDDVKRLIKNVGNPDNYKRHAQFQAQRNELLYTTLFSVGLRRQEMIDLDDSIFDGKFQGNGYSVEVLGKGNVRRKVIFYESLMDELHEHYHSTRKDLAFSLYKQGRLENPVRNIFITTRGTRFAKSSLNELCSTWSERSGIYHTPHMCRHTFATAFYLANRRRSHDMDTLMQLKSLLGHASLQVTIDTYLHVAEAETGMSITGNFFKLFQGKDDS